MPITVVSHQQRAAAGTLSMPKTLGLITLRIGFDQTKDARPISGRGRFGHPHLPPTVNPPPPGRLPGGRPGSGTASTTRSPDPSGGRSDGFGSPTMLAAHPELDAGFGLATLLAAISTSRPTPSASMVSNGDTVRHPCSDMGGEHRVDSTSSREKPHVVWVRSLVPKEKVRGVGDPVSGQRGARKFDHGADRDAHRHPRRSATSARIRSVSSRTRCSSMTEPTSGTMISTFGSLPAAIWSAAASAIARTCSPNRPGSAGRGGLRATRASDSIRAAAPPLPAACGRCLPARRSPPGLGEGDLDRELGAVRQKLVQRRIQQPDGHRQPVHRVEQLDEILRCRAPTPPSRRHVPARRRQESPARSGPGDPEEHVLGAAQADALRTKGSRADRVLGGIRVGADREAPAGVGVGQQPVDRLDQCSGLVVGPLQGRLQTGLDRSPPATAPPASPEEDLAGRAVDADLIAPPRSAPCRPARSRVEVSTSSASAPQTHVLPIPRATTAACEVFRRAR